MSQIGPVSVAVPPPAACARCTDDQMEWRWKTRLAYVQLLVLFLLFVDATRWRWLLYRWHDVVARFAVNTLNPDIFEGVPLGEMPVAIWYHAGMIGNIASIIIAITG